MLSLKNILPVALLAATLPLCVESAVGGGLPLEFAPDSTFSERRAQFDSRASLLLERLFSSSDAPPFEQDSRSLPPGGGPSSSNPRACALLGTVGKTTTAGIDSFSPYYTFPPNTIIAGPFEAGFDSFIDPLLTFLGCSPASKGYLAGGIDTQTALDAVNYQCGADLPTVTESLYSSLLWSVGAHSPPNSAGCTSPPGGLPGHPACTSPAYHFHQFFTNLYDAEAEGHSTKVGVSVPTSSTIVPRNLYGKYETTGTLPADLDACGGHFGNTPDSPSTSIYHHHVQDKNPFSFGCYGPSASNELVTLEECRSYYPACGASQYITSVTTKKGTFDYNKWCPCFDDSGSNVLIAGGDNGPTPAPSSTNDEKGGSEDLTGRGKMGCNIGVLSMLAAAVLASCTLFL